MESLQSNVDGSIKDYLTSAPRSGFKTAIIFNGYIEYMMVDALDSDGAKLDHSDSLVTRTIALPDSDGSIFRMHEVTTWQDMFRNPIVTFFVGLLVSLAAMLITQAIRRKSPQCRCWPWSKKQSYEPVNSEEVETAETAEFLDEDAKE